MASGFAKASSAAAGSCATCCFVSVVTFAAAATAAVTCVAVPGMIFVVAPLGEKVATMSTAATSTILLARKELTFARFTTKR